MELSSLTGKMPITKTLKWELKPVNKTMSELFKNNYIKEMVERDNQRAIDYVEIKNNVLDKIHIDYIKNKLNNLVDENGELLINSEQINKFYELETAYLKTKKNLNKKKSAGKTEEEKNSIELLVEKAKVNKEQFLAFKTKLSKDLNKVFYDYKIEAQFTKEKLDSFLANENHPYFNQLSRFKGFLGYFTNYNTSRENFYKNPTKSCSVIYRLIENIEIHMNNCRAIQNITEKYSDFNLDFSCELLKDIKSVQSLFSPKSIIDFFIQCDIDKYNQVLGGIISEDKEKTIDGINKRINEYRQKNNLKNNQLPILKTLHKQILGTSSLDSFKIDVFENDYDLINSVNSFLLLSYENKIAQLIENISKFDNDIIYLNKKDCFHYSQQLFSNPHVIANAISFYIDNVLLKEDDNLTKAKLKQLNNQRNIKNKEEFCSIQFIEDSLDSYLTFVNNSTEHDSISCSLDVSSDYILNYIKSEIKTLNSDLDKAKINYNSNISNLTCLDKNRQEPNSKRNIKAGKGFTQNLIIKTLLDSYKSICWLIKPFDFVKKDQNTNNLDLTFYNYFIDSFSDINYLVNTIYNKSRNHLSKKSYSNNKIKINFDNSQFLNGWSLSKEIDYGNVLFIKDNQYYLGVMTGKNKNLFNYEVTDDDKPETIEQKNSLRKKITNNNSDGYKKVKYSLAGNPATMLPKTVFSNKNEKLFNPSENILAIYKSGSFKKDEKSKNEDSKSFNLKDCHDLIDYYKTCIKIYPNWKIFSFNFSDTSSYNDLSDFYNEFKEQSYKLEYDYISEDYINHCINEGSLFLFQIYNKDFSKYSTGRKNLNTLYWNAIFQPDSSIKLNGQAEMFFRKKSIIKNIPTHRAGETIKNKSRKDKNGNTTSKKLKHDLYKDKRYMEDKFYLHTSIKLNYKATSESNISQKVNEAIFCEDETYVIGIDRGERHLLYISVIDSKGNIIEQDSLNTLVNYVGGIKDKENEIKVNYHEKLTQREKSRDRAKKSWTSIDNIKELKQGFLSDVIHKISKLIYKYNAIVCLEDLNMGFKNSRIKVDKQVYQNFEVALIKKLNYLVFKDIKDNNPGGVSNGLQLTNRYKTLDKLKQSGILFYVNPGYTSNIDPTTGFVNLLKTHFTKKEEKISFIESLNSIYFNESEDYFEFEFDYSKMIPSYSKECRCLWTACTFGSERYINIRNKDKNHNWDTVSINVTEKLKYLLKEYNINISNKNLKEEIVSKNNNAFLDEFLKLFRLTLKLRHSKINSEDDFILSPILGNNNKFYDSRKYTKKDSLPCDSDANGAYNIALKGLWNIQKIKSMDFSKEYKQPNLFQKNKEWFAFIQNKEYLK